MSDLLVDLAYHCSVAFLFFRRKCLPGRLFVKIESSVWLSWFDVWFWRRFRDDLGKIFRNFAGRLDDALFLGSRRLFSGIASSLPRRACSK